MIPEQEKDKNIAQPKPQFRNRSFSKLLDSMTISTMIIIFIAALCFI